MSPSPLTPGGAGCRGRESRCRFRRRTSLKLYRGIYRSTSQGSGDLSFTPTQIALMEHNLRALEPWMVRGLNR